MGIKLIKDKDNVSDIIKTVEKISSTGLNIGVLSKVGGDLLTIANVHEFGITIKVTPEMRNYLHATGLHLKADTITIPERSFVRSTFDENQNEIVDQVEMWLESLLAGGTTIDEFYNYLGNYCVGLIKEKIINLQAPPNHPYTKQQKGSSNPLIDSGNLSDSIAYEIID